MASLANDNGLFRVVVNSPTRRGYPIRLGRVQKRFAEKFRGRCNDLEDAVRLAEQPDAAVREWVDALDAGLHAKLVTAGLASPRVSTQLKPWLEKDLTSRVRLKDRSKKKLLRTHAFLLEFFGSDHDVRKITVDDAWDFHTWLHEKEGLAHASIRTHCGNVKTIFRAAMKRGLIRVNPFADLPSGSTPSAEPVFVSGDEIDQVIEKLPNATSSCCWAWLDERACALLPRHEQFAGETCWRMFQCSTFAAQRLRRMKTSKNGSCRSARNCARYSSLGWPNAATMMSFSVRSGPRKASADTLARLWRMRSKQRA
jgi:hypothetical protein